MKKLLILGVVLTSILVAAFINAADFANTKTVGTIPSRVNMVKREIANLSINANALVTHYNAAIKYGYVPLPLFDWREIADASADVGNIAANGGILASDTTPILRSHASGGTYSAQVIDWVASDSDAIVIQVPLPGDFSGAYPLVLETKFGSDGNTDSTAPTVSFFFNEYISGVDVTSDAFDTTADTIFIEHLFTVAAADITTDVDVDSVTITITPAAHTTNDLKLSSARLKYRRF